MTHQDVIDSCVGATEDAKIACKDSCDQHKRLAWSILGVTWALCAIAKAIVCAGREIGGAIRERKQ